MLAKVIEEDDMILWTNNCNTLEVKKKLNEKRLTFGFAANAFEQQDGVGDLMKFRGILFGAIVCKKTLLSKEAKELLKEISNG